MNMNRVQAKRRSVLRTSGPRRGVLEKVSRLRRKRACRRCQQEVTTGVPGSKGSDETATRPGSSDEPQMERGKWNSVVRRKPSESSRSSAPAWSQATPDISLCTPL